MGEELLAFTPDIHGFGGCDCVEAFSLGAISEVAKFCEAESLKGDELLLLCRPKVGRPKARGVSEHGPYDTSVDPVHHSRAEAPGCA